ncbi:hypothetical protein HALA3H3_30235 [Halomonas sp. A3H3]|nr:conserved hypothetical protein [Halomonas sp. 156]CAD5279302.1 conserved hypothetical protein [Halomonas sp. 113]CAD5280745.1 conserved hypothetical protein [Halomonas sp. 59]CAD5286875.1 conserved hypothetical protein [Halomonas sp. I3]CDG52018.1 hypothetical protein HALA3H3_30235 [Halomonas sp. A3H3]VXB07298.1 conserved hypothetical protein [Halomonas titanicae]
MHFATFVTFSRYYSCLVLVNYLEPVSYLEELRAPRRHSTVEELSWTIIA